MINSRRLTLQLTPLIDLLMIVMFAQYMEVRIIAERQTEQAAAQREATQQENEELRRQVDQWEAQQRELDQNQSRSHAKIGELIRTLFQIPEATINKLLLPRSRSESGGLSPTEIADLKSRFQQLANSRGDQIIDHLLTFNEMQKQFDVWDVYMNEDGSLVMTVGADRKQIKSKVIDSPESFVELVFQVRRQIPPTKETILLLCRYGDCRLVHRLSMIRGLPAIAQRIKSDGPGTVHFEYAVLGYRPRPEVE